MKIRWEDVNVGGPTTFIHHQAGGRNQHAP